MDYVVLTTRSKLQCYKLSTESLSIVTVRHILQFVTVMSVKFRGSPRVVSRA